MHWLVNANYHINCAPQFEGIYTSNELPHFISNMPYAYPGQPGARPAARRQGATSMGVETLRARRHHAGARVRHAGADALHERRPALQGGIGVGAVHWHDLNDSARFGLGDAPRDRGALRRHRGRLRQRLAVAPLRRTTAGAGVHAQGLEPVPRSRWTTTWCELWKRGDWKTFCGMLPEYADKGHGEGVMHDTAMLLGAAGLGRPTTAPAEIVTPYFGSFGHRADQRHLPGHAAGRPRDSEGRGLSAEGYTSSRPAL